jgi:hypothetical protein
MKPGIRNLIILSSMAVLLQGCVGLPSLVHVEHKHPQDTSAVVKRLESIETRLSRLEQQPAENR